MGDFSREGRFPRSSRTGHEEERVGEKRGVFGRDPLAWPDGTEDPPEVPEIRMASPAREGGLSRIAPSPL